MSDVKLRECPSCPDGGFVTINHGTPPFPPLHLYNGAVRCDKCGFSAPQKAWQYRAPTSADQLADCLRNVRDYLDGFIDADMKENGAYVPNAAMRQYQAITEALAAYDKENGGE